MVRIPRKKHVKDGLAMGEEAVFTTEMAEEKDGLIGPDLMRLGLERARNCTNQKRIRDRSIG